MKAVVLHAYGDVTELRYEDVPEPVPGPGEVLVRMRATSLNPIDWKMRSGAAKERFPVTFPGILGRDIAGEVAGSGEGVHGFGVGTRVMALGQKSYAEYAVVKSGELVSIPEELGFEQAAALPLVLLTGAQLIDRGAPVPAGEGILISGAVGSVGRVAVYTARMRHARVTAGVRESQTELAEALGAAEVVALDDKKQMGHVTGLDYAADTVGGPVQQALLAALKDGGTYASVVGVPQGAPRGIHTTHVTAAPETGLLHKLAMAVAHNDFEIPIAKTFPLVSIQEATLFAERGGAQGKVVISIP